MRTRPILFVGEKRSKRAVKMGVRWDDGRLAARSLFDALDACGIPHERCYFVNWFERGGPTTVLNHALRGFIIVGMGRRVQQALTHANIAHRALTHPAARGTIRRKEVYAAHVAAVLGGEQ